MKKTMILLLISLLSVSVFPQRAAKPAAKTSNDVDSNEEITGPGDLFIDNFDDNGNSWAVGDENEYSLEIDKGWMTFRHKRSEGSYLVWNWSLLDGGYPFSIETKMKHTAGVDDYGYGLTWGLKDADNFNTFNLTNNGYYRICRMKDGEWYEYVGWTESYQVNSYGLPNVLKIVKDENKVFFYINGNNVHVMNYDGVFGDGVGFVIWKNQTIDIDYLNVYGSIDLDLIWDMFEE